jgi:hypothetical protein
MSKSKQVVSDSQNFADRGEKRGKFGDRERADYPAAEIKPQVGRPPNRPPYQQYLRVTKAFLK